jgi:hypothetical protein
MEIAFERCCGIDIHKKMLVACLFTPDTSGRRTKELRTYLTVTQDVLNLRDWLSSAGCTHVAMEATGVYWKPVYRLLEGGFEVRARQCPAYQSGPWPQDRCARCGMDCRPLTAWLAHGQFYSTHR